MPSAFAVRARRAFQPRLELLEDRFCPAAPCVMVMASETAQHAFLLQGHVMDEHPAGLTVEFSGACKATAVTDAQGNFQISVVPDYLGSVHASVTDNENLTGACDAMLMSLAPSISITALEGPDHLWTLTGQVSDESPAGLAVTLGGIPSLSGQTLICDSTGRFEWTVQLQPGESGMVTAQTIDWWGQTSNTAFCWISSADGSNNPPLVPPM